MEVSSLIQRNNLGDLVIFREGLQNAGNFTIYDKDDDSRGEFYVHGPNSRLDLGEGDSFALVDIMHSELKSALTVPNNHRIQVECVFEDWVIFRFNRKRKRRHFVIARFVDGEFRLQLASYENVFDLEIRPWGENIAVMNRSRIIYYTLGGEFHNYNTQKMVVKTNPTNIFPVIEERRWDGRWERTFYKVAFSLICLMILCRFA